MDLIVETDLGRDPDDLFALCYLVAAGVRLRAVAISPGHPDQIAVARLLLREMGLDIPVGASKYEADKRSSGGVHYDLLDKYGASRSGTPDGDSQAVIRNAFEAYPDAELFVIGPATGSGRYLASAQRPISRATMQGGFLPYHYHNHSCEMVNSFMGKDWMPTFNLNGDRVGGQWFIDGPVTDRAFVGKNVCHTLVFDRSRLDSMERPRCRASELFIEAMNLYLHRHDGKKFHDPCAAVCHIHPEIGTWVLGKTTKLGGGWTTIVGLADCRDRVLADIDREKFWEKIYTYR
jgi:pyrimidine-specific ribonucleoside hydrolase